MVNSNYFSKFLILISVTILFNACGNKTSDAVTQQLTEEEIEIYLEKGSQISSATFKALSTNLKMALEEGGVQNAVSYCNLAASPIVDSLQNQYDATIKRTSFKIRNPENQPNQIELTQLKLYKDSIDLHKTVGPQIVKQDEQIHFFAPIYTMPLCTSCHGKVGESLAEEDYKLIAKLYPEDQAIDYDAGVWRGIWSITFNQQ